jgi:hypothetical protein
MQLLQVPLAAEAAIQDKEEKLVVMAAAEAAIRWTGR